MQLALRVQVNELVVSVSNSSSSEMELWDLQNSWGWNSFSFELKSEIEKQLFTIERVTRDWTKNGPTYFALSPGESRDLSFQIDDGWWEIDELSELKNERIRVRARLKIDPSPEAERHGVFIGTVWSEWVVSIPPHNWLFP